jgi:hypothetical protein
LVAYQILLHTFLTVNYLKQNEKKNLINELKLISIENGMKIKVNQMQTVTDSMIDLIRI